MDSSISRRKLHSTLAALGLSLSTTGHTQSRQTLGAMINLAGRNRTHAHRIVRCYAQLLLSVEPDAARRQMTESSTAVGSSLDAIGLAVQEDASRNAVARAKKTWADFEALLGVATDRKQVRPINTAAGGLFNASASLVAALQATTAERTAQIVSSAGLQRTRITRIAKGFLMGQLGEPATDEIRTERAEFDSTHQMLMGAPETTAAIRSNLELVQVQYAFITVALDKPIVSVAQFASAAVSTNERIVQVMDEVVRAYAGQVRG